MSNDSIDATAHGAGENFPLDDTGEQLDSAPADNKPDPIDRRVELFFFDPEFGISPAPPGPNSGPGSTAYPTWRKRVSEVIELRADDLDGPKVTFIEMADAHFRTNSAVVLPDGEDPDTRDGHRAITSAGVIATALRFNDEHPGRTLLVAGHTDTTADPAFNQTLSEERAQLTLALLKGGNASRETFKKLAHGRHTVADIKQILSWVSDVLSEFDCDPGKVDDNSSTASGPVLKFQNDYNAQRATVAPNSTANLDADGAVGLLTWGAFYDCYEFALQQELGLDAPALQALRDKLAFADPQHEFLGFSEYFPIEELGVDNFRSQSNRRVEILFFESGEEPDTVAAAADPETSDLYLPGFYERTSVVPAKAELGMRDLRLFLLGADGLPSANAPYRLRTGSQVRQNVSGPNGEVSEDQVFADTTCEIEWGTANDSATTPILPNYAEIFLNTAGSDADEDLANRQLFNLGYWHDDEASRRQAFQAEYNEPDGSDPLVSIAHTTGQPKQQRILG
ncbi:MAG: hypothetical protein ABIQ16_11170 [Polyangiaceae bacterium]